MCPCDPGQEQSLVMFFDLDLEVTQNVAQYPLHHDTYEYAKFEVASSNCLGRDVFTRKNCIRH